MPSGDIRYKYVRSVWTAGDLRSFAEIFNIVPRSIVATDLGLNYDRFSKKILKPELLTFRDIHRLSRLTDIDPKSIAGLVLDQIESDKKVKAR